jgi:prevent-host-death family protein
MSVMMTVGIRELRQNPHAAIQAVKHGERVSITERGRVVARLVPPPDATSQPGSRSRQQALEELIDTGQVIPAQAPRSLDFDPVTPPAGSPSTLQVLEELRADRF